MTTATLTPEQVSRERFVGNVADHKMAILRDDGLYRHLRFQREGDSFYWFDLITWPSVLTISGDCGCYVFSRTRDMFEFFAPSGARGGFEDTRWGINPQYWAEKLRAPKPADAEVYSEDLFRARVKQWLDDACQELDEDAQARLRAAVDDQITGEWIDVSYETGAISVANDFEHEGIRIYEPWDWSLREHDWAFLWCCWAIVWGIEQYNAREQSPVANAKSQKEETHG